MTSRDIPKIRLQTQQIEGSKFKTVKELVGYMGAMQAQDYSMAKWAVGVRLPGTTDSEVDKAINKGEIIRTHLMRPTWHFVTADDLYWMLELTAPHIKSSMKGRHKELEITPSLISKSNKVMEKALAGGKHLTRDELVAALNKARIPLDFHRTIHLFFCAELDKVICSGEIKDKKQTYALLSERVPKTRTLKRDEALATLAKRYFTSHCPATIEDFRWWSGLPAKDARTAVEMIKKDFISETIESKTYWMSKSSSTPKSSGTSVHLLPAYDEFTISYKDRSASLHIDHHKSTISDNGIFRPIIVVDGKIKGLWKRSTKKDSIVIETSLFEKVNRNVLQGINAKTKAYGTFVGKEVEFKG